DDDRRAVGEVNESAQVLQNALALRGVFAVEDGEAVGEHYDGLSSGQLPHAAHDEVESAERADGKNLVAELVGGVGCAGVCAAGVTTVAVVAVVAVAVAVRVVLSGRGRFHRRERADAVAP